MSSCPTCKTDIADESRFCSSCGSPVVAGDEMATFDFGPESTPPPASHRAPASSMRPSSVRPPSSAESRHSDGMFLPGSVIAGRYRIITLLGKGGMGEVYRADDLTLGQPVALKFLPSRAGRDQSLLERFRNEVRIARKVSHPNVCRVYDVGDVDDQAFFTMEYIDGEDLASLLRRIGRLPQDKALDIARQLCAGLAAAHAQGVLHRDMKPANIMLDGRGQVVITDFGLAGVAGQIQGSDVRSGTPAYMAPEQLAGEEVSVRSDIYSLGLVLYEVFTGKRALSEKLTVADRISGIQTVSRPSSVARELDPAIERVILRCLEADPASRPPSVLGVAAALPGGDPLAAALAAGETPSPALVAASGETSGLRPPVALACLAGVLVGLAACLYLTIRSNPLDKMGLDQTPEVLTQKARDLISQLGYAKRPQDSAYGLYNNGDMVEDFEKNDKPRPDWDRIFSGRPSVLQYWYRESARPMVPTGFHDNQLTPGMIQSDDPPEIVSGMVNVELDPQGRLIYFQAIPPERETSEITSAGPASGSITDWNKLFAAAGLDASQFRTTAPIWNSLAGGDTRAAWTGVWPGNSRPLRVEAASWRGRPVFFSLIGSWTKPQRAGTDDESTKDKIHNVLEVVLFACLIVGAASLARRNYRQGRGDRIGAARLAAVMFCLEILLWLCRGHFPGDLSSFFLFVLAVSTALCLSGATWLLYLALEPWIRRYWPQTIISWSRLLAGRTRDAVVGRDVLLGVILGVVWIFVFRIRDIRLMHLGGSPSFLSTEYLMGGRQALGRWLYQVPNSILGGLQFFFLLLGLKVLLRKQWIAVIVFVAIFTSLNALGSRHLSVEVPTVLIIYSIAAVVIVRFGLVAFICGIFTVDMLGNVPFSSDFSAWYMNTSLLALFSVVALAGWGFYYSLGGQPLWKPEVE